MPARNSVNPLLTKEELWKSLREAASHSHAELVGPIVQSNGKWSVLGEMDSDAAAMASLFLPLLGPLPSDRPLVVGHLAQSMDGFIARANGESHWISGNDDLDHTHRLRAFCDAVLVGAKTVAEDDCRLTVRRCDGDHPLRIVLDPRNSLADDRAVFHQTDGTTVHVVGADACVEPQTGCERHPLPVHNGVFRMDELLAFLTQRGVRRLFVEGGGVTITHFMTAGLLDRLHLAVAPVFLGQGRPGFDAPLADNLAESPRPHVTVTPMGADWLFDCDFGSSR